jgi:hypothetical protein
LRWGTNFLKFFYGGNQKSKILSNLEIYIELLQETVNKFKSIKKPKYFETKEFMLEYVNLEDKILDMFDTLVTKKVNKISKC